MHCACSSLQHLFQGRVDLPRVQTRCRSARRPHWPEERCIRRPANRTRQIDRWTTTRQWTAGNMKSKPRAKTNAGLAVISEEAPRKFMDHGWVTVNYNIARCSLIIVPVELSSVGVTTRRRLIKDTYPREGSALVRKKKKKTTSLHSLKFASLVLQVHKDWILARSTTEQAWSAVRLPQIRTPSERAGSTKPSTWAHKWSQVIALFGWKAPLESNLVQSSCK